MSVASSLVLILYFFSGCELTHFVLDVQITGANVPINKAGVVSTSRGLVGDTVFAVIPNIKPVHTFVITAAFQLVRGVALTSSLNS